jgi:hypothetical protein
MDGEAEVLEHRIEVGAFDRRDRDAGERVGGEEDEQEECRTDPALHGQDQRLQPLRQVRPERRDDRAEQRQDEHPEEHRALVVPPDAGELVEERLRRIRILDDVDQREVGDHVGVGERGEGEADQQEPGDRRGRRDRGQPGVVAERADERHDRLHEGEPERQDEGEVSELGNHWVPAVGGLGESGFAVAMVSCQTPCFFKASTTSAGM